MFINAWFVSIIMLLVTANSIPDAFNVALMVFYCPFVMLALYVVSLFPYDIWYGVALMSLFLWARFSALPYL